MKLLSLTLLLTTTALAQGRPDPSLAPFRTAAHKAYTDEMAHADQPLCPGLVAPAPFGACLEQSLRRSESHLAAYRAALQSSIVARQKLLGPQSLEHFQSAERLWNLYSEQERKTAGDVAEGPELAGPAEEEERIELIRTHMQTLDRVYYTLLHSDCGACLVDH